MPKLSDNSRADAADFLRVICIFIIAWYHIWQQSWLNPNIQAGDTLINIYPVVTHGYMFVDIMLLISGFLLMLGYIDGRYKSIKNYYLGRAFRILPSYLFCILIMLFAIALPQHKYGSTEYLLKDLLSHLTFTHNMLVEGYNCTQLNVVLWTLAVEVQFYLIFPLIAKLFRKHPAITYTAMLAVCFASKLWVYYVPENINLYINRLPAMLDVYANGMLAALIYSTLRDRKRLWFLRKLIHALLIPLACIGIYYIMREQSWLDGNFKQRVGQMCFRWPLTALGSVLLVSGSLTFKWIRLVFSNPVSRFLCGISYNFYIWHQFLAVKLKQWHIPAYQNEYPNMAGEQPWQQHYTLLCFAAALAAAVLVTYLIEKPCAKLGQKLIHRKDTKTAG